MVRDRGVLLLLLAPLLALTTTANGQTIIPGGNVINPRSTPKTGQ